MGGAQSKQKGKQSSQPNILAKRPWGGWGPEFNIPKPTPQQIIQFQQAQALAQAQRAAQQRAAWAAWTNAANSQDAELAKAWRADVVALAAAVPGAAASRIPQVPGIVSTLLANNLCQRGNV
jgi:hypothetical protein